MHTKKHSLIIIANVLIFFFILLFYYSGVFSLRIATATPLLVLPALTAFSLFHSPLVCALTGLACGIFMDACAISSFCFNAILLFLAGTLISLAANNLFNKNVRSAAVLSLLCCACYFILHWLIFNTNNVTLNDSLIYLLKYALPSALYSALFILPFYYLFRFFHNRTDQ